MSWNEACCEGLALAAAVCGDTAATLAEPGLEAACRQDALRVARALAGTDRHGRRRWVRARLRRDAAVARAQGGRSPRALSLLAARVPDALARAWISAAPRPRAGYVPDPALVDLLHRIARGPAGDPEPQP